MRFLLIPGCLVVGVIGGGGAALFGQPPSDLPEEGASGDGSPAELAMGADDLPRPADGTRSYVPIGRQMIIPVVRGQRTTALVLFELALDVPQDLADRARALEPRLRDVFLRELFAMSHTGAFDETYTDMRVIEELRRNLRAAARRALGEDVAEVLVLDIIRQEL